MIPKNLIEEAKSQGACPDAIKWLEESPRSFEDLVSYSIVWAEWAIRKLCSPCVWRVYRAAVMPDWNTYRGAIKPAREAYAKSTVSALLTALKTLEVK
jgi:hypothetical protein